MMKEVVTLGSNLETLGFFAFFLCQFLSYIRLARGRAETTTFYTVQAYCLHCHRVLIISKYFGNFRYLPVTLGRCDWYVASFEWGELTCSPTLERSIQDPAFPFSGKFLNWPTKLRVLLC